MGTERTVAAISRGMRRGGLACLTLAACVATGCWGGPPRMDYSKAGLVQVGGTVRFGGKPLPGALVVFENPENGTFSFGRTDDTGKYALMFDSVKRGVTKGRKTVRIRTAGSFGEGDPDARPGGKELVPARYNSQSTLTVEVTADSTSTDFDLDPGEGK